MIWRKIYRAKRLRWDELDFEYLAKFYLSGKNREKNCFVIEDKASDCEMIMTCDKVYQAKDIYELKYNLLYHPKNMAIEKYYDEVDADGWFEIEVSLKNGEMTFEDVTDVYNVLSDVLSLRGAML